MTLSIRLIDDDITFSKCLWVGINAAIEETWIDANFHHIDPKNTYDTKHWIDFMYPRFLDIIREAREKANSVIILSDATFISNLSDELQEATLPQKLELFWENDWNLKLWVLSWTPVSYVEHELWREYMERLRFIKRESGLYIPWIEKPVIINEILEWLPWNQKN